MAKFACKCEHVINLSQGTDESELAIVSERQIETIAEILVTRGTLTAEEFFDLLDVGRNTVYRCPSCQRLHVEDRANPNEFLTYVPESSKEA